MSAQLYTEFLNCLTYTVVFCSGAVILREFCCERRMQMFGRLLGFGGFFMWVCFGYHGVEECQKLEKELQIAKQVHVKDILTAKTENYHFTTPMYEISWRDNDGMRSRTGSKKQRFPGIYNLPTGLGTGSGGR